MKITLSSLVFMYLGVAFCQDNAGSGVAPLLIQCYNSSALPEVLTPNGRPPATINILIEYIRKLEDANPTMTPTQLSLQLIHRFRQDGIIKTNKQTDTRYAVPFSPRRLEYFRHKVILTKLLPRVQQELKLGSLNTLEMCSLHYMTSSTIDKDVRGDENIVCSKTARYTSRIVMRRRRDLELADPKSDFDVFRLDLSNNNASQCPLELGVVFTNYGTVKAANVLAGIATGMSPETVPFNIDNRYAATLAGELAEAALYQSSETVEVGAPGGWNSTINPKYYFLQKNNLLQVTDAEIRGALDGLYMSLNMASWRSKFPDLKISQILDMYYSPFQRGVFDRSFTACNRNLLYTNMTSTETLSNQVYNFAPQLNEVALIGATIANDSYKVFVDSAIKSFNSYLPKVSAGDLGCQPVNDGIERIATDLLVFVDFDWTYETVQPLLSFVLDNIDVSRFGSRYQIFNGQSLTNITNQTSSLSEFHELLNKTAYEQQARGFDFIKVLQATENIVKAKLNNNSYTGAESTIVLIMPRRSPSENERSYMSERRREIIGKFLPDLRVLVIANSGSASDYESIVQNPTRDVAIVQDTSYEETLKTSGNDIVKNIRSVPRAIVNPSCTSEFNGQPSTFTTTDYVEPTGVNYYRISPHYFYSGGDDRRLKIRELSTGTISFCISRDQQRPDNSSSQCESVRSMEKTIEIKEYCTSSFEECLPIYLSVTGNLSDIKCRDKQCRFPDSIKYTISMENVGCHSGSTNVIINVPLTLAVAFILAVFKL